MHIRKARKPDFPEVLELARRYGLDYHDMEADHFWVAEENGQIKGICGLKIHSDCQELCSLGVEANDRGRGLASKLVRALLRSVRGQIYLATIIPEFFERLGFETIDRFPTSMIKKSEWCEGCQPEKCQIMVRRGK
jgi:N-acetylglutamate synthase-like GNAT family acetyltransferase